MAYDALDYLTLIAVFMLMAGLLMLIQETSPTGLATSKITQSPQTIPPTTSFNHAQCGPNPLHYCFEGWGADPDNSGILYATWNWGDGSKTHTTVTHTEHSFPGPGEYTVTLKTTDADYETGEHSEQIIIA